MKRNIVKNPDGTWVVSEANEAVMSTEELLKTRNNLILSNTEANTQITIILGQIERARKDIDMRKEQIVDLNKALGFKEDDLETRKVEEVK